MYREFEDRSKSMRSGLKSSHAIPNFSIYVSNCLVILPRAPIEVVPIVIGALGCITKEVNRWIEKLGITCNVGVVQQCVRGGVSVFHQFGA